MARVREQHFRRTADTGPLAGVCFIAALFTSAVLSEPPRPLAGLLALTAIAVATAVCARPDGALAVGLVAAMFADHFFVPPYDAIAFAGRDLRVLIGIPLVALAANALVRGLEARTLMDWWRWRQVTTYEMWLLAPPAHDQAEPGSKR